MTEEVSRLSLAVDSSQVTRAGGELDKFAVAGKSAETAAKGLEQGSKGVGSAMAGIAAGTKQAAGAQQGLTDGARAAVGALTAQNAAALRVQAAQASLAAATAKASLAQETYNRVAGDTASTQAQIASAALRLQQAQASQATNAARLGAAQALLATQTKATGAAAALTAQQSQQLSFQLHDFFVQVAAGQNPLQAFVQQGSQLSGTFGGVGGALRALQTVFTATRIAIGGLAGAAIGLGAAFAIGAEQSLAFQRSIILTGNAAGVTEGQFNDMARTIADSANTTIGSARETLQALVASGRFTGEALAQAGKGVELLAKVTGQSRDEIIRDFVKAADGPTRFAETTNRSLNFLTAKQLDYIRTLEDQGRTQEALAVTFEALNQRTEKAAEKVGTLERAWLAVKKAVSEAADTLLAFGRDETPEQRIAAINKQLNALATRRNTGNPRDTQARKDALEAERDALKQTLDVQRQVAASDAQTAQTNQAKIAFDKLKEQTLSRQARLTKELADANALADKAGASPAERAAVLAGIREKFAALDSDANALAKAKLQADLDAIEQALKDRNAAVRDAQTVFNALRQAGTLDDAEAFAAQRAQIRLQAAFEIQAKQDEIARLQQTEFVGKDAARLAIENAKQVAAAQQEIARVRGSAAAADEALTIQQIANTRRRIAAQQQEQISISQAFEAVKRAHDLELSLFGSGDVERSRAQARAQIEEKFRADIERATSEIQSKRTAGTATTDDEREFEARLALLQTFLQRSLAEYDAFFAKRKALESDASVGAAEAFRKYQDEAGNAAKQSEAFFTRSLSALEDALVEFVTKGRLNWRGLADFIVAEITRVIIKQQIANALEFGKKSLGSGSAFGDFIGGLFGGGRAQGGTVIAGNLYRINEGAGPGEILNTGGRQYLLASENGKVQPQAPQQAGDTYQVSVYPPAGMDPRTSNQIGSDIAATLARARSRNG